MDCNTDMENGSGGTDRAILSQAAVARAFGAVTIAFGIIELGLGGYVYATTQKNAYYGSTSNAAGAWWAGLSAIVAGTITCVHLNKESVLAAACLNLAAFAICLAGAVIDGIMTVQFWQNMATCVNIKTDLGSSALPLWSQFVDNYMKGNPGTTGNAVIANSFTNTNQNSDIYRAYALFCGFWSVNSGAIPPFSATGISGLSTAQQTLLTAQVKNLADQNSNQVFCVANGYDKLNAADVMRRNNEFCYQVSAQNPLTITDVARLNVILQASVAFCVLPCVMAAATFILTTWLYFWIHPADQGAPMLVGVEPKGLQMVPPPLPALPPAPRPVVPPPPTSNIDLKPLGQIK